MTVLRRIFYRFIVLCLLLAALTSAAFAAETEVASLSAQVTVSKSGASDVTVTAKLSFGEGVMQLNIPLGKDVSNVRLAGYSYKLRQRSGVTYLIVTNEAGFTGTQELTYSYSLPASVSRSGAQQRYRLTLPEGGWEYRVRSYALEVDFPAEISARPSWTSGWYDDVIDNYLTIHTVGTRLTATSVQPLLDHEVITMELSFPAGTFRMSTPPGTMQPVLRVLFYIFAALAALYWFLRLRGSVGQIAPCPTAGAEETAGACVTRLYGDRPDPAALLAHWGNLGYLCILRTSGGRIRLQRQMDMGNERSAAERRLFHALFRSGDRCDVGSAAYRAAMESGCAALRAGWMHRLFRKDSGNPRVLQLLGLLGSFCTNLMVFDLLLPSGVLRWFALPLLALLETAAALLVQRAFCALDRRGHLPVLVAGGVGAALLLFTGAAAGKTPLALYAVLLQLFCAWGTRYGGRRTRLGWEHARRMLGLRRFLVTVQGDELDRILRDDPLWFYRLLPFAETLGVGQRFSKRMNAHRQEPCPWLIDAASDPRDCLSFYDTYTTIAAALRMTETLPERLRDLVRA